jgi:hypothetical protein
MPKFEALDDLITKLQPKAMADRQLIRVGGSIDGGYLIPDDLEGIKAMFSPGVSIICDFDLELAEEGIDVYMADASVESPPHQHPRFHFEKKFLGSRIDELYTTLDCQARSTPHWEGNNDFFLQMDIEGHEYQVIHSLSDDLLKRFRTIVIEFHNLDRLVTNRDVFSWMSSAFEKLLKYHDVVHIHPNNANECAHRGNISVPKLMEFTFYRRDRFKLDSSTLNYPHPLDQDCVSNCPSLVLPNCWQKKT